MRFFAFWMRVETERRANRIEVTRQHGKSEVGCHQSHIYLFELNELCVCGVCTQSVWPHQLQIGLGAGESGLQAVLPPSVYRVRLRLLAAHRPAGNAHTDTHMYSTCTLAIHVCFYLTDSWLCRGPIQGEKCIMGQQRSFRKRKDTAFCVKGKSFTSALTTQPCQCTEKDFTWWAFDFTVRHSGAAKTKTTFSI